MSRLASARDYAGELGGLLPQHAALIRASAIAPEVAAARGYRSVTTRAEARRLGFSDSQARVPALLVPVWGVTGEVATYQLRPDAPRVNKQGKAVKYETPAGSTMVLDVPPAVRAKLADPSVPLVITEGVRKADSAVSAGIACIALLGVWNWRGTNHAGGKVALPDWEAIALNGRTAYLAFDSDVVVKPEVLAALVRLKAFLEQRGAVVLIIRLPQGEGGAKQGLDDFFAAGHDADGLFALATPHLPSDPRLDDDADDASYRIVDGRLCRRRQTQHGPVVEPLANFAATITEEITVDDGVEQTRHFVVQATLATDGGAVARVPAERFTSMEWVPRSLGAAYIVGAGLGARDHLRAAIQTLSSDVRQRRVLAHTGWREVDGRWMYLTASGAVGHEGVEVDLGPNLSRYALPRHAEDPVGAMRLSLRLLRLAPLRVTAPLLAAVYRAPTASVLLPDFTVWVEGPTGALKSSLLALALNHYGPDFDRRNLPGWASTANQIERMLFVLKDAVAVVDDYAPAPADARDLEAKAQRVLRTQGNVAPRNRLRADLSERPGFPPRGLVIATGEQHPAGQSLLARMLIVELERGMVDLPALTAMQDARDRLPHALAGFVSWLAPQMPGLAPIIRDTFAGARARACGADVHLRVPEAIAHLWVGLTCVLQYAEDVGAVSPRESADLLAECWAALLETGKDQSRVVQDEAPALWFLRVLDTLLVQRKAQLLPMHLEPADPDKGERYVEPLGWEDDEHLYLLPDAVHGAVSRFCRETGASFVASAERVRADLVKLKIAQASEGRTTITTRCGGKVRRVLKLQRDAAQRDLDDHQDDRGGDGDDPTRPASPDKVTGVTDVTVTGAPR